MQDFLSKRNNAIIYFYYLCTRKLIFRILALRPLSTRLGAFLSPKHSPEKISEKFSTSTSLLGLTFFYIFGAENYVFLGRTFFYFYGAKNYGG